MSDELVQQQRYWDRNAQDFDAIYSHTKGRIGNLLDSLFRQDIYQRFDYTLRHAEPIAGRTFLDVGCGPGRYVFEFARRQAQRVVGVDISGAMIALCRQRAREEKVNDRVGFVVGDLLGFHPDEPFDVCVGMGLFDYIEDPLPVLAKMRTCARDRVIISFPRLWTWRAPLRKLRLALRRCSVYFYTPGRIDALLRASGFPDYTWEKVGKSYCITAISRVAGTT